MEQDLHPERVPAPMIAPAITGWRGQRATVDSKAGPMRAASLKGFPAGFLVAMKEVIPVAMEEDPAAEGIVEGKPCNALGGRACF